MNSEFIKILGEIAGIGGISLGVLLILFREIIRKNLFKRFSQNESYYFFRLLVILVFAISALGISAYVLVNYFSLRNVAQQTNIISDINLENEFPVKIGDNRETVRSVLGQPQEKHYVYDSFYSHGLNTYYDRHDHVVDGFHVTLLKSGVRFNGKVKGIRAGDSFWKVKSLLGNPISWGLPSQYSSLAVWSFDNLFLIATFDRDGANAGAVNTITYCIDSSLALYVPIVIVTIQELRSNMMPTFLEKKPQDIEYPLHNFDVNDPVFQQDYRILNASLNEYGGATIVVGFDNNEIFHLWIYPLADTGPRIRALLKVDHDGNLIMKDSRNIDELLEDKDTVIDEDFLNRIKIIESGEDGIN